MLSRTCLIVLVLFCAATLIGKPAGADLAVSPSPCSTPEADPVVEIVRSGPFNGITADSYARSNYNDFIGTISNTNFYRFWDGTCGSYKVPVRIVAPKEESCGSGRLANLGLIELLHPNYIGYLSPGDFEGMIHGWNDPIYDPLLDHGFHEAWANLRVPFLFGDPDEHGGGGLVYVGFQANNFNGELDYIAVLPENQGLGLHLERPQDYAFLYRDVSKWLRQAKTQSNFVNANGNDICQVSDVIGFGYSFTSWLLKSLSADPQRLNSAWGQSDSIFPRGRVLDGMLLGGFIGKSRIFGENCVQITSSDFIPLNCDGPDPVDEGPMVLVESETDIQFYFASTGARPGPPGNPGELDHYRVHEINSASHLDATYYPLGPVFEFFGLDPSATRQNPLDRSPVLRADLINLLNKIRNNTPLPPSSYMQVHGGLKSGFELGVNLLDRSTGNGFGGIVLPQAAAPLGLYRGLDCHSPEFDITNPFHYQSPPLGSGDLNTGRANYVLESSGQLDTGAICRDSFGIEGLMTPYSVVDGALGTRYCQSLYPTRQAYSQRVIAAADDLISRRLLLPEDRESIIADAEAQADLYPECVPPPTNASQPSGRTGPRTWKQQSDHRSVVRNRFDVSLLNLLFRRATSARY